MQVKELTKQYDGKTVVDSVTFAIPKGKVLSLIGPNGAGKSTVMGIISRLIARDAGLVDFEGRDIAKWKSKELSKRLAILDILDALGVGGRVVGTASTSLDYLQSYINEDIANLGTIKEADLEAVMSCEPDVIFIGGRLARSYDALTEIAPVVYLSTDTEQGVVESVRKNANTIASLFGLEEEVDSLMADFDSRIAALAEFAEGKTAIVGLVTSGGFNVLGNDGRCSMICREVGFENIGVDAEIDTATHGNEASFEFVVEKDPDYIFVLDRDAAIQTEGAQLAQEIVENELVKGTRAYTDGHIVYLSSPAVWYTAEGGITALDVMLQDLESELLSQ